MATKVPGDPAVDARALETLKAMRQLRKDLNNLPRKAIKRIMREAGYLQADAMATVISRIEQGMK